MIIDNYGREMTYLRVAVTDKCNLRCTYCMPHEKMNFLPKSEILNYDEITRSIRLFSELGIKKIRFTGGEPFVRKDFISLVRESIKIPQLEHINITTNGVLTYPYLEELKTLGIGSLNISIDTLKKDKFNFITKRDEFDNVIATIQKAIDLNIKIKINVVLQYGINDDEIIDFVTYFRKYPIDLRFIEHMPFNEVDQYHLIWNAEKIREIISEKFILTQLPFQKNRTTTDYSIDQSQFKIGIIAGYTRNFCDTCNRIRLTSTGQIKTCLYADPSLDLRNMLRNGHSDKLIKEKLTHTLSHRFKSGKEAELARSNVKFESMSKIGG